MSSGRRFITFDEFVEFLSEWNRRSNAGNLPVPSLGIAFCERYGITDNPELCLPNTRTHQAVRIILTRYTEDK